ncbi:MAG: 4-hydroxythreonine-4-phosphate dehydrogenase PdxA [Pseudomonadota bacterium]
MKHHHRVAVSVGEPAGIGPDIAVAAAQRLWPCELVFVADPHLLASRAEALGTTFSLRTYAPENSEVGRTDNSGWEPSLLPIATAVQPQAGELDQRNTPYVIAALQRCVEGCLTGEFSALATGPIHKGIINIGGISFSGHTEYLAEASNTEQVVMLLVAGDLRVALATTHLPLREVPDSLTKKMLLQTLCVINADVHTSFGISSPRISVLGLNPHAGEGGHIGREEIDCIGPAIEEAVAKGINATGPWSADTAFNPPLRAETDVYLAMFHDQGLPVLKYAGFGSAVNVTLGLPFPRTSVDHGTALELAGSGKAIPDSMLEAINLACKLAAGT